MYHSCILAEADLSWPQTVTADGSPQTEVEMEAIVAERGQITLPKAVRDALG